MPRLKRARASTSDEEFSSNLSEPPPDSSGSDNDIKPGRRVKRVRSEPDNTEPRIKRRKSSHLATYKEESESNESDVQAAQPEVNGTPKSGKIKSRNIVKSPKEIALKKETDEAAPKTVEYNAPTPKGRRKAKTVVIEEELAEAVVVGNETPKRKTKAKTKIAVAEVETKANGVEQEATESKATPKRRRKTKEEKEAEAMPLADRTADTLLKIGAHVSAAGGVHNSINNCLHIGGNAFALFLKSQRKWENPALKDEHATSFREGCATHKYSADKHVLPHGSYLVNLCSADPDKAAQAYNSFLDDLTRCEALGIKLYNFHPGNTNGHPRPEAIARLADRLNKAHKATSSVITVLENMAASRAGNTIGGAFEDIRDVIALVEDKSRVGVCLDTCHAFAGGYDLRTPEAFRSTMTNFDNIIGMKYLRAVHLNDSKAPFNSHRDLHQQIGLGFLGLRAFHNLVNDARFHGLPLVLETPIDHKDENGKVVEDRGVYAREIKLLESLVDMDPEGEEFRALEAELAKKGETERSKHQTLFDKKQEKVAKGSTPRAKDKAKRKASVSSDEELSNE